MSDDREPTTKELFDEVMKRLDRIEERIRGIPVATGNTWNLDPLFGITKCWKCGLEWKGTMGYVCSNAACPIQPKVTSSIT